MGLYSKSWKKGDVGTCWALHVLTNQSQFWLQSQFRFCASPETSPQDLEACDSILCCWIRAESATFGFRQDTLPALPPAQCDRAGFQTEMLKTCTAKMLTVHHSALKPIVPDKSSGNWRPNDILNAKQTCSFMQTIARFGTARTSEVLL